VGHRDILSRLSGLDAELFVGGGVTVESAGRLEELGVSGAFLALRPLLERWEEWSS